MSALARTVYRSIWCWSPKTFDHHGHRWDCKFRFFVQCTRLHPSHKIMNSSIPFTITCVDPSSRAGTRLLSYFPRAATYLRSHPLEDQQFQFLYSAELPPRVRRAAPARDVDLDATLHSSSGRSISQSPIEHVSHNHPLRAARLVSPSLRGA